MVNGTLAIVAARGPRRRHLANSSRMVVSPKLPKIYCLHTEILMSYACSRVYETLGQLAPVRARIGANPVRQS
jgi:hypothetical protein